MLLLDWKISFNFIVIFATHYKHFNWWGIGEKWFNHFNLHFQYSLGSELFQLVKIAPFDFTIIKYVRESGRSCEHCMFLWAQFSRRSRKTKQIADKICLSYLPLALSRTLIEPLNRKWTNWTRSFCKRISPKQTYQFQLGNYFSFSLELFSFPNSFVFFYVSGFEQNYLELWLVFCVVCFEWKNNLKKMNWISYCR